MEFFPLLVLHFLFRKRFQGNHHNYLYALSHIVLSVMTLAMVPDVLLDEWRELAQAISWWTRKGHHEVAFLLSSMLTDDVVEFFDLAPPPNVEHEQGNWPESPEYVHRIDRDTTFGAVVAAPPST